MIRFLWLEGVTGAEIRRRLSTYYGDSALLRRSVYEWIEKFKGGRTSVTHEERAGRPSTSTTDEKIQQAREMVLANRRVTIDEVPFSLQISRGSARSVYQIIHDKLGFHKVCARSVPRELTAEHKRKRIEICQHLLDYYSNEGKEILSRIVTGDETWVNHYEPETESQSMAWRNPGSPTKKKFKTQSSAGKVMLTVFWDSKGPILEDYLEKVCTINIARYSDLLANNLKPAIRTKNRGLLLK